MEKTVGAMKRRTKSGSGDIDLHMVRVFFECGSYVVMYSRTEEAGDLLSVVAKAMRAVRDREAGRVVQVTVDVDPTITISELSNAVQKDPVSKDRRMGDGVTGSLVGAA